MSVCAPLHWVVHTGHGDFAVLEPLGAAAALIRVRGQATGLDLAQWLKRHHLGSEPGLHGVCNFEVQAQEPHRVAARFDYGGNLFQGHARVTAVRQGSQVAVFIAAAARAEFEARLPQLSRILRSVRMAAAPGAAWWDVHPHPPTA